MTFWAFQRLLDIYSSHQICLWEALTGAKGLSDTPRQWHRCTMKPIIFKGLCHTGWFLAASTNVQHTAWRVVELLLWTQQPAQRKSLLIWKWVLRLPLSPTCPLLSNLTLPVCNAGFLIKPSWHHSGYCFRLLKAPSACWILPGTSKLNFICKIRWVEYWSVFFECTA